MKKKEKGAEKETKLTKIGGLTFFVSFLMLIVVDFFLLFLIPIIFSGPFVVRNWLFFAWGISLGALVSAIMISGRLAVFIHEMHHKFLSGLIGNKPKKLQIGKEDGFFEYEYTKETAPYNALIALAPYFFPLLTIFALVIALIGWRQEHHIAVLITGCGYGADLYLNTKGIGPYQTDFKAIRGGYFIGVCYVVLISFAIFGILASWVSNDLAGLRALFEGLLQVVYLFYRSALLKQ